MYFFVLYYRTAAMVDAVYRGNIDELLSVINHLEKYIIAFIIVLLVLLSVFHFSKFSVHVVPLIIVTFGLMYFALNVLMLALAEWIAPDFSIDGFWTYVGATVVVWLVNVSVGWLLDRVRGCDLREP